MPKRRRTFSFQRQTRPAWTWSAEQWAGFLAEPTKHWRKGYSARALAYAWQEAKGFPTEVRAALARSGNFLDIELLLALPEHKVPLPGGSRSSQNDIWILARTADGLVSMAVEGKVSESFGPTLGQWLVDESPGKSTRLAYLQNELGLDVDLRLSPTVRYQLLHRTASAIIEAKRYGARHAVMLVHSFSQSHEWFEDYSAFASLLGAEVSVDDIVSVGRRSGVNLHVGWVSGDIRYLNV
jgi:hypothetical protein